MPGMAHLKKTFAKLVSTLHDQKHACPNAAFNAKSNPLPTVNQ